MDLIDATNNEFYNSFAENFDKIPFKDVLPGLFLQYVDKSHHHTVFEIGAGAGAFALWMVENGFDVTCLEPAKIPAEKARKKGLQVECKTIQEYKIAKKFDVIVAISSLIHLPKAQIKEELSKIASLLSPKGIFFVSFIEGKSESFEDPTKMGKMRYFAKYTESELKELLEPYFSFLEKRKIEVKSMHESFFLFVLQLT